MPVITVDWRQGNDQERRKNLASELAATASRVTGCPIDDVTVIVRDCEPVRSDTNGTDELRLGHGSPW